MRSVCSPARICAAVLTLMFASAGTARAQTGNTFTVNSTSNSSDSSIGNGVCRTSAGVCTLRAAIQEANATSASDRIVFAIGTGPARITISSTLPTITRPVEIDGTTQPGFIDAPLIEVHGSNANGITITGGNTTLRGLVINGFSGDAIIIRIGGGNVVEGCYIGTDAAGSAGMPNTGAGIRIESANNRIGGRELAQRNIISGNTGRSINGGVLIYTSAATANIVQGNFIGLDVTGMVPIPNEGRGVAVHDSSGNFIGGALQGAGNLIASNRATGVRLYGESHNNVVQGNWIGVDRAGNVRVGLFPEPNILSNARGVQIRGNNNTVAGNLIAGNTYDGVLFFDNHPSDNLIYGNYITANGLAGIGMYYGSRNRFMRNAIWGNAWLGIEIGPAEPDGPNANDPLDADTGTNERQNHPRLTSATTTGVVRGALDSAPSQAYTVELFASPMCTGAGEGIYPIGFAAVTTDTTGTGSFNASLGVNIPAGWYVTGLATDSNGNTSEFSPCALVR